MSNKPGLRKLKCEVCGQTREVEAGIRIMFCCATEMVEVKEEEAENPQELKVRKVD